MRGQYPHHILHIDISEIKLITGTKYYLQTIMDSYSRYVIEWRLTSTRKADDTEALLKSAIEKILKIDEINEACRLVSDQGKENLNDLVKDFLDNHGLIHRLPKIHVRYSNNLIEVLFRALKNNYLYHVPARTKNQLMRRLKFYFDQHNNVMPHGALEGKIPNELYHGIDTSMMEEEILKKTKEALEKRLEINKNKACSNCPKKAE